MKKQFAILTAVFSISLAGCLEDWLVTTPQTILTDEQVYADPALVKGMMADYYDRIPFLTQGLGTGTGAGASFRNYGEAMGQSPNLGTTNNPNPGGGNPAWNTGTWGLLRDIHVTMNGVTNSTSSQIDPVKPQLLAELRFIRALWYFTMARSYGGIPILTDQLIYDLSGDLTTVQVPRSTEEETWDFILDELDAIMDDLGNAGSKTRANRASALALKSRAALYAASVARYNNEMDEPLVTPLWEAGIPASEAVRYFTESLEASRAILNGSAGNFALHTGSNPSEAFALMFTTEGGNTEVIFAKDYAASLGKKNDFTLLVSPGSFGGERYLNWGNTTISPTLNVVEQFQRLDGSSGTMVGNGAANILLYGNGATMTGNEWTYFDTIGEIFDGYDGRMKGTVMVPGGTWYGLGGSPDLLAGIYEWTGSSYARRDPPEADLFHPVYGKQTGEDGPFNSLFYSSSTGFLVQKYLDPDAAARRFSPGGSTWEIWFRLAEIYLNAAEAAFELGLTTEALGYINTIRQRAGFGANSLASVSREVIRRERESEFVFEGQLYWDVRRWRTAHIRWDGVEANQSTRLWVLFPYRIHRPGHANHGKYVFNRFRSDNNTTSMNFGMGSYYAGIGGRAGNPLLTCNPLQGGC